jgi:hypothetical protein
MDLEGCPFSGRSETSGRGFGSTGLDEAAEFIATQFREAAFNPAATRMEASSKALRSGAEIRNARRR